MLLTKILGSSTAVLLLAVVLMAVVIKRQDNTIDNYRISEGYILSEIRIVTGNPKLVVKDIALQIKLLGSALSGAKSTIKNQNTAVDKLGVQRDKAFAEADRQSVLRGEVIQRSKQLSRQLKSESLNSVEKHELETELRRVQDLAYQGGL